MDQKPVDGMTMNERLFHFGLFGVFDVAARTGDAQALVQVLLRAQLSEEQALQTAAAVVAEPEQYGF